MKEIRRRHIIRRDRAPLADVGRRKSSPGDRSSCRRVPSGCGSSGGNSSLIGKSQAARLLQEDRIMRRPVDPRQHIGNASATSFALRDRAPAAVPCTSSRTWAVAFCACSVNTRRISSVTRRRRALILARLRRSDTAGYGPTLWRRPGRRTSIRIGDDLIGGQGDQQTPPPSRCTARRRSPSRRGAPARGRSAPPPILLPRPDVEDQIERHPGRRARDRP